MIGLSSILSELQLNYPHLANHFEYFENVIPVLLPDFSNLLFLAEDLFLSNPKYLCCVSVSQVSLVVA